MNQRETRGKHGKNMGIGRPHAVGQSPLLGPLLEPPLELPSGPSTDAPIEPPSVASASPHMGMNTVSTANNANESCAAHTVPVAGMVYLRRPVGQVTQLASIPAAQTKENLPATKVGAQASTGTNSESPTRAKCDPATTDSSPSIRPLLSGPTSPESRQAVTREVARLLWSWLEAYDGRRPVSALRRGPFSPTVLDELRGFIRDTIEERSATPSRLLRVHLPPSHHHRLAFTASAAVDGKVRAIAGHLARYDSRWRVESVTLLRAS